MVADRSITVKLKLDNSDFNRGLAQAAVAARRLKSQLEGGGRVSGSSGGRTIFSSMSDDLDDVATSAGDAGDGMDHFGRSVASADKNNNSFGKGIQASNSHMALMVQYAIALGPALVPALAAAVPLAAALGSGLAVASVGAGTAILAFQGVGDALKAMNDFAIDPTEAHLKALNQAMDTLGPAGQEFVVFLQELRPEVQKLQNVAQQGLFPGIEDGITSLLTQMPLISEVIATVSVAMGELARQGGEALTNPFWTDFFTYIRDDATDIITNFSVGFGKLFEGVSALLMDFGPLTLDISAGFANMGRAFSGWAQGLDETQGFQEFVAYIRETGPQILDTIGHLGKALVDLGVALSGLPAQASLAILNTLATVLSAIASSPIGPGLLAAAVGISAITRAIAVWDTVQASAMMQFFGGKGFGKMKGGGLSALTSPAAIGGITKAAGAIGVLALAMSDLDNKAGLSGALMGGAIGLVFSPWAAALGLVAGATLDAAAANDELTKSLDAADNLIQDQPGNFTAQANALEKSASELKKFQDATDTHLSSANDYLARTKNLTEDLFGKSDVQEATDRQDELTQKFREGAKGVAELSRSMGNADAPTGNYKRNMEELTQIATDLEPALDHLHVSINDIRKLQTASDSDNPILAAAGDIGMDALADDIRKYEERLLSVPGKSREVGKALADLGAEAGNTQADVDALSEALDNLFSPALDYSQAMDDWRQGLADLAADLKGSSLDPNTTIGRGNRDVIRERVEGLINVLNTAAANGAGPAQLTRRLMAMREQLIEVGRQAGLQGVDLRKFLATLNLTPKQIRIIVKQMGVEQASADAKQLKKDYEALPEEVKTDLEANGVPADATVRSLMAKYVGLTHFQAVTILRARDAASPVIQGVLTGLALVDGKVATATVTVRNNTINTVEDRHLTSGRADGGIHHYANGGMWPYPSIGAQQPQIQSNKGPGGIMWAETGAGPWEAFISGHPNKIDRSRDIATDVVNRLGGVVQFADGGRVGSNISAGDIGRRSVNLNLTWLRDLERALRSMRHEAKEAEHAEDRFRRARMRSREVTHRLAETEKRLEHAQNEEKVNRKEVYRLRQLEIKQRHMEREAIKRQTQAEKEATKQRDQATKAADKWKEVQADLLSQAQTISQAILSQGAIFGGGGTSVTVGGILAKLRQSNENASKFRRYIAKLRGAGLDERVIQQLLEQGPTPEGVAAARNLAHASEQQIRQINRQERQLVGVAASTGALGISGGGGINVYMRINKVETTDVKALSRELPRQMRKALRLAKQP